MLKQWLKKHHLEYDDILVDRDPAAAQKMVALSGQMGVPFTTVEDDAGAMHGVLGFNRAALSQLLNV